jgi:putative glycosyltransferase (TIGR04372 family)
MNHFANTLGDRVSSRLVLHDGSDTYFCEGMGAIQEAWEAKNLPPLIKLTDEDRDFGMSQRSVLGIPEDAWFVCLHVRSSGFHKEGNNAHQAHRNADIKSYLPAIREVVRRGGWVVRMGDRTMPPLPAMEGVVDYAHTSVKSQRMDIILCASCRFFVGVASGLSHIPTTFGVPCVMTNWCSNAFPVYSKQDLFLPKLESSVSEGGLLSFSKWLAPECRSWSYAGLTLDAHGIRVLDNTEDELREVVVEMIDRLDGRAEYSLDDRSRLAAFNSIATKNGLIGYSRIGRDFLSRHAHLLLDENGNRLARESDRRQASAA